MSKQESANNVLTVRNIGLKINNGPTLIEEGGNVDFVINEGEVVLLLGSNGSGKTTLVESLFGQGFRSGGGLISFFKSLTDKKGAVSFNSVAFNGEKTYCGQAYSVNDIKSQIGYSENEIDSCNNYHTFWGLLKMLTSDYANGFDKDYAEELYKRFCGKEPLKHRFIGKCSGGQRKKFSILKALIRKDAKLYVFDEPVNCLDTATMIKFRDFISENRAKGSAFLIITHCKIFENPDRVYRIKDRHLVDETKDYKKADCLD